MPGPNETYEFDTLSDWYHGMDQPSILDITISIDASVTVELNRHLKFPLISKDRLLKEPPIKVHKCIQVVFQEDEGHMFWILHGIYNIDNSPFF